jgi:hypothetical protein
MMGTKFVYDGDKAVLVLYTDGSVLNTTTFGANGLLSNHQTYAPSSFYTFDPGGSTCQSLTATASINYTRLVTAHGNAARATLRRRYGPAPHSKRSRAFFVFSRYTQRYRCPNPAAVHLINGPISRASWFRWARA